MSRATTPDSPSRVGRGYGSLPGILPTLSTVDEEEPIPAETGQPSADGLPSPDVDAEEISHLAAVARVHVEEEDPASAGGSNQGETAPVELVSTAGGMGGTMDDEAQGQEAISGSDSASGPVQEANTRSHQTKSKRKSSERAERADSPPAKRVTRSRATARGGRPGRNKTASLNRCVHPL